MATKKPLPFVLAASHHGAMIVSRLDYRITDPGTSQGHGVGLQILTNACYEPDEIGFLLALLTLRRRYFGDGVLALDCGANVGTHTIEWARHMQGWGRVLAFEAQERIFYALAGNVALNNCFNATVRWAAVGRHKGMLRIPVPDYCKPSSYGSLELVKRDSNEFIGQPIHYGVEATTDIQMVSLDSLDLPRVDLIKIDVEGMELDVLAGAVSTLGARKPILVVEHIKTDKSALADVLQTAGYKLFPIGFNFFAVALDDPVVNHFQAAGDHIRLNLD